MQERGRQWWRGPTFSVALLVLALLAGLGGGFLIASLREAPPPPPQQGRGGQVPSEAELRALERIVAEDPPALPSLLRLGHAYLDRQEYGRAIEIYKKVLARDEENVEALIHMGVLLAHFDHPDQALERLNRALSMDPTSLHALWDKAHILFVQKRDAAGAITTWQRFVDLSPAGPDRERAEAFIREARRAMAGTPKESPGAVTREKR